MHADRGFPLLMAGGCTIGHRALLHGCVIADNCLVGSENRQKFYRGRGSLSDRTKVIPGGRSDCGKLGKGGHVSPADEVEKNRTAAGHYVENGVRFRSSFV